MLKAWHLCSMEKIKDLKVRCVIPELFMSINLDETVKSFKACGKEMVVEIFDNLQPSGAWT